MKRQPSAVFGAAIFLIFFLSAPTAVQAQEPRKTYTLQESIAEAIRNNRSLASKKEKIEQARQVKNQAWTEFLPKFSTTYRYVRLSEIPEFRSTVGQRIFVGTSDNFEWRGTISQPVFTGFALLSSFELARLGIDQSETNYELEKLDLVLKVKEAYFNILIADKGVEVAEKDVEFRKSNLKMVRSFYKVGMVPVNDVLRAEVELANAQQNLVSARNLARLARSSFNTVLSRPISSPVDVKDVLAYEPERGKFEEYVKRALKERPEMKLIRIGIRSAEQEERLTKSKLYPEVAVTYEYIKEGDTPEVAGSDFADANRWQAAAVLRWTFWEWGKTHYAVKEKESLQRELVKAKLSLEDQIKLQIREALLRLRNAEENIPTTKKAVAQGEENLRVNEERYKAQVTTIRDVLDAQTLLTRARVNYYNALYNHHLAKASLLRAVGTY